MVAQAREDAGSGDSGGHANGDQDVMTVEPTRTADGLMDSAGGKGLDTQEVEDWMYASVSQYCQ